jgi:hypothetical protein
LTPAVVWVPDDNLRALFPDEDHGAAHVISSLEEWRPEEWGLPALPVSRLERDEYASEETRKRGDEEGSEGAPDEIGTGTSRTHA